MAKVIKICDNTAFNMYRKQYKNTIFADTSLDIFT